MDPAHIAMRQKQGEVKQSNYTRLFEKVTQMMKESGEMDSIPQDQRLEKVVTIVHTLIEHADD